MRRTDNFVLKCGKLELSFNGLLLSAFFREYNYNGVGGVDVGAVEPAHVVYFVLGNVLSEFLNKLINTIVDSLLPLSGLGNKPSTE